MTGTKEEYERIWLEPAGAPDRCWCQDNVWGDEAVEYVRVDLITPAPAPHLLGWRDISSASRDGSEVLVWNGRRRHVAHFDKIEGEWVSSFKTTTKRLIVTPSPTHWSPLPTEPATTEGQP